MTTTRTLITDPAKLFRADLTGDLLDAVERVAAARHLNDRELVLDDLTFLPDGEEEKGGRLFSLLGGIVGVFGLALIGIFLEGDQAEPWMRFLGPLLVAVGGFGIWTGKKRQKLAAVTPRRSGAYLLPDVLLCVSEFGCRSFPKALIRGFEYRSTSEGSHFKLFIRYRDGDQECEDVLFYRDLTRALDEWLAASSSPT